MENEIKNEVVDGEGEGKRREAGLCGGGEKGERE